jgi:hypothetical protein
MPKLMQILEEGAEFAIRIEDRRRKRPDTPVSSKGRHFERANQKKGRRSFTWNAPLDTGPKNEPKSHEARRSQAGHDVGDPGRFTWTAPDPEPHVEPPDPEHPIRHPRVGNP